MVNSQSNKQGKHIFVVHVTPAYTTIWLKNYCCTGTQSSEHIKNGELELLELSFGCLFFGGKDQDYYPPDEDRLSSSQVMVRFQQLKPEAVIMYEMPGQTLCD